MGYHGGAVTLKCVAAVQTPMRITKHPERGWLYRNGSVTIHFTAINSTGVGYWELSRHGMVVAKVVNIADLSQEDNELFHDIRRGSAAV